MVVGLVFAGAVSGFAQDEIHHSNISVGLGPAIPVGNTTNYLSAAPLFRAAYGYRFNKWFQADAGLQIAFGAANNQNAEVSDIGALQGGDHEFMIPLGGRIYIPTRFSRVDLSAGGGAAYLHYSETIPGAGQIGVYCYSCTSRAGWGGYGLASARYFLDDNHIFSLGTTFQYIAASTNGQAVGNIPPVRTTDHWTNVIFEFGLSF